MAAPTGAFVMKNALVKVEGTDYANQCRKAQLTPDTPIQTMKTLVPDGVVQDVDSSTWTFEITALQINGTGGLAKALRDAAPGDELDVELAPQAGTGKTKATFTILAMPPVFGGEQGNFATLEMAFPVIGQPVFSTIA